MKKTLITLMIALTFGLTLSAVGCNSGETGDTTPPNESISAPMDGDDIFDDKQPWN